MLLGYLEDIDPRVRERGALALGLHKCEEAQEGLARLLQGDPFERVKAAAAWALREMGKGRD